MNIIPLYSELEPDTIDDKNGIDQKEHNKNPQVKSKNIHEGHRERMRKRYLETGLSSFAEHEILELILFGAISRGNVNPLAHKLLNEFGSISNLFSAPVESIMQVTGAKESVAVTIKLIPEIFRYAQLQYNKKDTFPDPKAWDKLFRKALIGAEREHLFMLCLDSEYHMKSLKDVGTGTVQNAVFDMKDILKEALFQDVVYVVIAHNHPNKLLEPSKQDIHTTERIKNALNQVGVKLLDHLILTDDNYKSIMYASYSIAF